MKKKPIVISGIIITVLCALCLSACDRNKKQEYVYDSGVVYRLSYNDTAYTVSGYGNSVEEVEILSECNGLPVVSIDGNAFREGYNLVSVEIPDSITSIGELAFYDCHKLESIKIPFGITRIESRTFSNCRSLSDVEIPSSVESIGDGAFQYCRSLTSIDIPNSVKSVDDRAFCECSGLTSIKIPNSVTNIESEAFRDCGSLTSVELPNSLESISGWAFSYSNNIIEATAPTGALSSLPKDSLQTLVINGGKDSIRSYMFDDCAKLTSITISSAVTVIETNCIPHIATAVIYCDATERPRGWDLHWCDDAQPVVWDCNNNDKDEDGYAYAAVDGIRYRLKDGEATVIRQVKNTVGEITIPASVIYKDSAYNVTAVGNAAFDGCRGLTGVTLPPNIVTIGGNAFGGCWSLKQIALPDDLKSIESYAFYDCGELTDIEIPSGVTTIAVGAFNKCGGLTSIKIPDGVTSIGGRAFAYCVRLTEILIPSSVESIERDVFDGCNGLTKVYFGGSSSAQWNAIIDGADTSPLSSATIYYYRITPPPDSGFYWHYAADWVTPEKW